jgi:serine/threonine protein kinase
LPIVDALLAAHERGIVHRDLKPDNIFLSRGSSGAGLEPKVLDFGIAKFEQSLTPNLTSAGTILGSPAYMSPEQARGETDVDCRTDVWAMCVVLYEAITGRLPFSGDNCNALMYAILDGQPKTFSELSFNESLLWSIIARGLEKDRERPVPEHVRTRACARGMAPRSRRAGRRLPRAAQIEMARARHAEAPVKSQIPLAAVATVLEMPRPLPVSSVGAANAAAHHPSAAGSKPAHPVDANSARSESKSAAR